MLEKINFLFTLKAYAGEHNVLFFVSSFGSGKWYILGFVALRACDTFHFMYSGER